MGREVGSTQQRSTTNPTSCGIAHFQALPIPSLIIRSSEGVANGGLRSLPTVHMQHFASRFVAVGGKSAEYQGVNLPLC